VSLPLLKAKIEGPDPDFQNLTPFSIAVFLIRSKPGISTERKGSDFIMKGTPY
jgi:hypothetical protein